MLVKDPGNESLADYIPSYPASLNSFTAARYLVNVQDKALQIAQDAMKLLQVLQSPGVLTSVQNNSFTAGSTGGWIPSPSTSVNVIQDTSGNSWARLTTHSPVDLSQAIVIPGGPFNVTFDYQFQTTSGALDVLLNSVPIATLSAPGSLSGSPGTFRITVSDPSLLRQQDAILDFHFDGTDEFSG